MLKSFAGPFILTTAVANFILVLVYMLRYFDDFVGKNLGFSVFAELFFYFSMRTMETSLPLGVLLASLMTFGNLGENFELTAIKSSGISLLRTLRPLFLFVVGLSIGAYFFNNYTIPNINLKAYSLLYDVKNAKPALDIKAGTFYNGIPNYSIKAADKLPDGKTLIDVIIYDHSLGRGNKTVILADSSLMYTIMDDRYLKLELYNGHYYSEESKKKSDIDRLYRTAYDRMEMVFSLASFDLKRRKEELFLNNRQMKNISELTNDIDSFKNLVVKQKANFINTTRRYFTYHLNEKSTILAKGELGTDIKALDTTAMKALDTATVDTSKKKKIKKPKRIEERADKASIIPLSWIFKARQSDQGEYQDQILGPRQDSLVASHYLLKYLISLDSMDNAVNRDTSALKSNTLPVVKKGKLGRLQSIDDELIVQENIKDRKELISKLEAEKIDTLRWDHLQQVLDGLRISEKSLYSDALTKSRNIKTNLSSSKTRVYQHQKDANLYTVEKWKKYAGALACILMFLIGAPLGAIIKKGGLGVPTILAILFFIIYYAFTSVGEKQAKTDAMNPLLAVWMADMVLLPFGLFFLRQARIDARLFDLDIYFIAIERLKSRFVRNDNKS